MFKKKFPSLSSLGSDGNTAFLRAARAGHLDKVLEHLKANININTSNSNGLNALHLASKDGHVHVVTELLKRGAVVDAATKKGNTALHIASLAGQEEVVKLLVATGAAVNVQSQNGFTPLYMAAQENHDNVVRFLLANEANQSLATEDGFTPLAVAMQQGHDKVVAVLLENDTRGKVRLPALHIAAKKDDCKAAALLLQNNHNPDVTSKSGFTPLHIAAHYGNESIANLLLNRGADVNYAAKHNITPLHVAAKWGKTNMVSLLLEKGANIESKTRDGLTPLHCAARSGHEQVVDMMLERGAPISSKTKNGLAPLHMASQGDHVDAARILLYHRASVDEVTVDYLTALHVAAHCGHVRVAKLLLDRKADPNARALNGFTPLHIACKKNRIKVVELLLKHGASIEATTESGLTPLHVASFMGCMNIVIYLLQHEANPDVPTVRGETPLHLAARANQTDIIRILLRNGAQVDARAREQQTPLHIASRLGNVDIVMLLLQHGAAVDSTTKDLYTALHIAGKEGQEEVAAVLLEHGASLTATTKKGFTPLHLAAKYGNMKVAKLVLQRDAPVDAQGKNGVTPLHVASHYDHQNVALLLLDKGASPHATAKNGHTPLHIAARKNQMDIATTLLEYGAKANAESKAGFTPLHLSSQEGHTDMSTLLIEHQADTNHKAKNGLTPLHLCAQEDRVNVAAILVKNGAQVESITKAGYTPLHVASHFGQGNMVRFLLQQGGDVKASTNIGYTPLHQASQQGHTTIVNLLLENAAQPNSVTSQGQTALSIAQKLGYISVVESLKVVTDPSVSSNATLGADEKYRVVAPESMQETFMSDSEDEGGEDTMLSDQPYRYLTVDEMKSLGDDSLPIDVTRDERMDSNRECMAPPTAVDDTISPQHTKDTYQQFAVNYTPDNVDIGRHPLNVGFLVSFLVDARGGAMRGCRHSGVRVIVPPRKATMPMRVTCRYLKRDKLSHPPPLMEGEALASRILELGPVGAKFLGPVIIEVPHFGSLRGMEREIVILRSDNGETWREHTLEASDDAVHQVLNDSFEGEELSALEEVNAGRTTRILTTDFPQYFAVVSRIRQEVHAIGPEGGMVSSSVVPQVQAVFPQGALTKKIKVGLQAQPVPAELTAKLLGNRVAVSPIVTVEPRRRKFHKPITLTIPVPQAANKGMINQYSGDAPTLRLLCSITGGTTRAQWEDVTGSTPLTFVNDCVSFTTTVSARFWLMDCRNIGEATKMATELYKEAIHVPFMAKFVVFSKRVDILEARLRVFCMTDDKEDKTLEHQEHFLEVAKSRDVEVLEGKSQYVEFAGNLVPVTKSGDQLQLGFRAFRENRLPFTVRVKDPHADTVGRILFMKEAKVAKGEPPQQPICILNIVLPESILPESGVAEPDIVALHNKYTFLKDGGLSRGDVYQRTDLRLSDISNLLGDDWVLLASELKVSTSDVNSIKTEYPSSGAQQAMAMLRLWLQQSGNKATGNALETALRKVGREDIVQQCIFNVDEIDRTHLDQSGFDSLKEELGPSRDTSLRRDVSLDITYDEQDIMKESESVEELVEAEKKEPYQDKNITNISGTKDDVEKQTTDVDETKYIGEEKVVEEERKSVAELKEIFAQDKRDRQYERQPRPFSDKETPPQSADDVTQRATTTIDDDTTTTQEVRRIMSIPISDIPDRLKDDDTSRIIPSPSDTLAPHMASEADQRRDSELFQGVSEELVRLETTYKVTPAEEESEVLSPKVSKTPPPSPAEFKDTTGVTTWQTSDSLTTAEQPLSSQEWTETSQDLKTEEVKPGMSEPVIQDIPRETDGIKSGALSQIELDSPANKSHTIKVDESTTEVVKTAFYTDRLAKHSLFHEIASDNHKKPETENVFSETSSSRAHIQESSEDLSPVKTDVDALFLKCMTGVSKPNLPEDIPLQPSKQNIDTHGKKESISSDLVSQTLEPQFCGTNVEVSDEMFDKECDFHHKKEKDKSPVFFETCSPISKTSGLQFAQVSIGYYKDDIDPKDIEKHKIETERGSKSEAQIVDLPFKEMHAVSQPATHNLSYPIENVSTESINCQPCGIKTKEKMMQSNKISPKLEAELTAENVEGQQIIGDVLEKLATKMQPQIIESSSNFQNNLEEINGDRKQEIPFEKETTKYPNQSTSDTASTQNIEPFALTKDIVDTEFCTSPSIVEDILENPLLSCNNAQVASEFLLDDNKQKENYLPEFLLMRSTSKQSIDKNLILPKEFLNDETSTVENILSQSFQSEPDFEPQIDKTISSLLTETKSPETDIKDSDFTELLSLKSVEQRQIQDLEQETVDIAQKSLLITHATLSSKLEADETTEGTNLAKCPERLQKNTAEIDVSSGQVDDWDTYVFGKIQDALPSTTLNQENVCVHKTPQIQRDIEECKEEFVGIYIEPSIPMLEKKEITYVLSENKVDLDKLPTESVSQIEKEKQKIIVSEVEDVDSKIDENSLIEQETYDVLEGVDEIKKEIEPAIKHMGSEIEAIAYKTVFPQEDHIFVQDEKGDVSKILSVSSKEFSHPPTIQIVTPKADDVILKKSKITLEDLKYDIADILKEIDKDTLVEERETESDVLPVVTTPTTQRRGLIGSQSLRLTRDNRPTPLDVSHIQTDEEDNEDYIVSEPGDNISRKSENSVCRVNSSPDIIGGTQHPLSQAWLIERATKISEEPELERRRPMFHIESEEDDLSDQITDYYQQIGEHDELIAQINQGMSLEGVDQLGTNSRNLYIDKDNEKDHACTNTREVYATINDEMEKVPTSLEKTSEELIDGFSDQVEVADTEVKTISKSLDLDDQLKMLLPSKNKASKSLDLEDKIKIPSSDDKKLKRVERRFERMASETLEKEHEEGSTPEVEHRREAEFERMVSQLSIEEVADFQKEYSQLWDEGGMTPSEDWDSRDPDTPSGEIEADSPEQLPKEESCRLTHDADQRESPAEGSLTKPFLPKPSPRLKPEPRDDFVTPQTSLETFGPEGPIAVSPLSYIGTVSHGVNVGMAPSETITEHEISKEDIESKPENEIDGDVQSYSDRKKFWEQMTGKSKITSTTSFEQSESVVTTKQRTISLDSTTPPVPRPRSTINTSPALTISALSEVPAKSETERDSETISFRTSLIHVQLPPVYLGKISATTGSSDISDREGSETEAKYIPSIPVGVPTTAPSAVAAITQGEIQSSLTESSDSEAEYIADFEGETLTYVNTGFVPDEEELEIPVKFDNKLKEKKDQIEIDASKQKESKTETLFKEMKKVNPLGVETSSILEKSFHHAAPIAITRKTLYERSVSLPTEDLIPFDHNGSVRAKKRYFEAQIKKEMVVDQLMTQLEEEASPEHKSIHQTTKELCTIVDQESNITHQGHTDMFIHKPDKHNKPPLSEETEIATSKEKEVIETKIITVKDIAKGFEESKTWELKETMSKSKECKSKDLPKAVENEPFLESKTEEVKQEYSTDLQTDTSKGRVNVSFDMEPTVKEVPKILKVKDLARGFEKESSFDGLEKDTKKDYVSESIKTIDGKKPKEIVSGVAEEINMIYKTVICEKSEESDERKAVKDIRSVFESKIQGPTFDLISKIPIADTKKTSLAKTLSAEQPFGLKELSSNVQQVLLEEETKHDFEQGKSMGSQGETKEVINLVSGLEEESSSQKAIEVTQYKTDIFTKLSDSLEDHVDKSEIEGSEKEKYIDEDMTNIEKKIEEQGIKEVTLSEEPIPFITVTLSGIQRTESYIEGESEDTASESDVTPEDSRERAHPLYQPEEHIPDTVWEVPVQEQVETIMDEVVHDIPIEKQVIIEKDEDEYQEKSDEEKPVEEQDEGQDTLIEWPITEEEARVIAEEVIESIEAEVTKRAKLTSEFQLTSSSTRPISEIAGAQVAELLKKLAGKEVLGPHEIQIMESILVRKQREQIKKISRTDTTTSSMEITDEDLRSSGVETDLSPLESHTGKLDIVEDTTLSEEMATELGIEDHETMKDGKSYIDIALEGEEVVEKTLAEVRESLGAAQEELIEEHKKKEEVIQKKESPSEFEFKVLTFENKLDEKIEESHFEDMSATADYIECDEEGKLITHATDIVSKDQYNKIEERTQLEKEEMGTTYDGIAIEKTDTKAKEKEKHDFKFTETKLNDVRSEKNIQEGLVSETHTTASFSDEEDSLLKSKVIKTKTITKHGTGTSELTEDLLKEGTTSEYKICVETKIEGKLDSSVICKKDIKQAEEAKSKLKEKETTIEETDTGTMKTVVTEEKKSQSQVIKETKLENITSFSKYEKDDEVNLFIPESKEGILDAKAQPATITSVVKSLNNDKLHIDVYHSTLSSKREEKTEAITKTEHKVETTKTFEVDVESLDAMLAQKGLPPLAKDFETKEIVKDADQVACKEEIKRTSSEESQRSLSQDESAKSPVEAISSSSSTTTSGKRGDSEMVRVIERPDGSETTVVVLRHSRVPKDGESSSSGERSISAGANLRADRRSGADFEAWSSSGESHYHSFEQTSDSGRTYSRPCSSDAEALMAGAGTTGSSEYESALTSQEISSRSGITSQDYHTAVSSLSSRESMRSLDSESSGHLASIEVSSETSETLVPSALELEKDMEGVLGILTMDDDDIGEHRETTSRPPTVDTILEDKSVLEPYDTHIPVHIIRGESPPKIPHHRAYSITPSVISDLASTSERDYVATDFSHVDDGRLSPFEMISESDILDYPVDEIASEDEIDIPEPRDIERTTSTDESADDERPHCMKRSHEMIFQPEPRAIISDSPLSVSPVELQDEKFGSSVEEGSILSMSYSSTSEVAALRTVIELSRTDSERQDGSGASEQLSMTVSGTSEQLSLEDIDIAGALPVSQAQLVDFGTCTYPPSTSSRELHLSSVTITTSSVDEYGVQSVCTQVTSQSHTPVPDEDEDETVNIDEDVTQNGPTQVDYVPEYDDYEETHKRSMGHRRKESTSSFIPAKLKSLASDLSQDTTIIPEASIKTEIEGVEDAAESDKYTETMALTLKEVRSDEKKDIDEAERIEEESYQTEADQGFHRDLREGRVLLDDAPETEEDTEAEIRDLDASRPHSQVSKSDSEGHRPISSGFSDDRPDSELTELLKQCSLDGGKDFEDPIERPLSPEPGDECEIKDDMPEFSSEAQASVKELEIEYSGAFSRSIGYASHVSPIREERIGKRYDEAGNMEISQLACEKPLSEHEDDMAEAEAAFQMAPYAYSAVPSTLPATILEDPVAEKHELETRERTLKEKQKIQEAISPGGFIPDITVTQHMTPLLDKGFHYPDLELEEVARSASQTPASMSSRGSSETETDQGREYILEEEEEETDDYIAEENEHEAVLDEKGTETSHSGEEMSATEEKTVYETLRKESPKPILEQSSPSESPTSDSFEMLETPEITDDYVVIEEVGKEAAEHDTEGKSLHISKKKRELKKHDPQDDEVLIPSPPAPTTRMTDLKYYPEHGAVEEDMAPFPFEDSPPTAAGTKKSVGVRTQGFESGKDESDYEREVEAGKKWIEMQFQGDPSAAAAATGYGYEMEFERAPLEDIKEEEVNDFDQSSKVGSIGSYRESIGSFGSVKDSYSSTPEYDVLAGRRYFTRSGDHDDVSMSSLQEFEQLEHQIALEGTRKRIHGSQDSLNGSLKRTSSSSRSGQGDDISLSSLKEFEGLETACIEATKIETRAKEEEALLSEIEEGHESQVSESESCETMSAGGERGGESVDSDDYEKRMFEIDEIIRQAQTNVERFIDTKEKICLAESTESSVLDKTESVGRGDSMEEVARIPELDLDQPFYSQHGIISKTTQSIISKKTKQSWRDANDDVMQTSTDSLDLKTTKTSTLQDPLGSTNSLDIKTVTGKSVDMTASADSIDFQTQLTPSGRDDIMTDSIELAADSFIMANSTDSLEIAATAYETVETGMTDSIEEESILGQGEGDFHESGSGGHDQSSSSGREGDLSSSGKDDSGEHGRVHPPRSELMLGSTDSLDPTSSTATHATYQYETDSVMSSSFTSGGSNTMVSSTDTLDPTGGAGGIDGIDLAAAARSGVWFEDVNGGGRHFVSEVIEPSEEDEFSHTIRRTVELPPEVRKVSFKGPDAERALREYVERFAPGKDVTESEVVDSEGNVHIKRVVQRRVVIRSEDLGETELTGPDLDEYLRHVAHQNGPGDDKQYSEERTGVPDSDYTHLMTSISGGDQTSFSSPSHSTEVVTHHTYVSRHITHPSSSGDVVTTTTQQETVAPYSTGDLVASHQEKEKDLQVTSVEKTPVREEEEDGADTQPEVASARLQTTQTRVVGDDGFITTVTTVTQQRESPDNSDLQELLDKLAQEKH